MRTLFQDIHLLYKTNLIIFLLTTFKWRKTRVFLRFAFHRLLYNYDLMNMQDYYIKRAIKQNAGIP